MSNSRAQKNDPDGASGHIVPSYSDLVVLLPSREDGRLIIEQAPNWVARWVGKSAEEIAGEPAEKVFGGVVDEFPTLAAEVLEEGKPVEGFTFEFKDARGEERAVAVDAQRVEEYVLAAGSPARERAAEVGPAVVMRLRDVTDESWARRRLAGIGVYHGILGRGKAMLHVFYKIEVYGPTDASVVISGETGTGKELVARALHDRSARKSNPFVAVNCTALSEDLFESELFGHEQGAFTGAMRAHKGRFERADKGTLFLDEIGDMPSRTQAKLLRAIEQGVIERVGGEREQPVDVRIVAATNISLEQAVAMKRFRADLYHRLCVFRIHVPPLRERIEDLPLLVEHFLDMLNRRYGRSGVRLTPEALRLLAEYHWPGNVRELRNVLERVYVENPGPIIGRNAFSEWVRERDFLSAGTWNLEHLDHQRAWAPVLITPHQPAAAPPNAPAPPAELGRQYPLARPPSPLTIQPPNTIDAVYSVMRPVSRKPKDLTEEMIRTAFAQTGGNATQAAAMLGVHKATLYRKMKTLGLTREELETAKES